MMLKRSIIFMLVFILNAFFVYASDEWNLIGTYTSPFPHPFQLEIINENMMRLEWTETGKEFRSWEESKTYNYTLSKGSVFLRFLLNEDVPTNLWEAITGDPEPRDFGNVLLGLFGIAEGDGSDDEAGRIMGVTYSTRKFYRSDIFTVDVPNYVFTMHGPHYIHPIDIKNPSSELKEGDTTYRLRNLYNLESDTAWVEGRAGNGIGESFEAEFNEPPQYLAMINGYISAANPSLYWKNGRVKTFKIEGLTTGKAIERAVLDTPHLQTIDIRELSDETRVKITIADVYPGSRYSDTCIHFMSYSEYAIRPLMMFEGYDAE